MQKSLSDRITAYYKLRDLVINETSFKTWHILQSVKQTIAYDFDFMTTDGKTDPDILIGWDVCKAFTNEHTTRSIYPTVRR